jgi:hypothetical protein
MHMESKPGQMVGALVMMASRALWTPWHYSDEHEETASSRLARFLDKKRNHRKVRRAVARLGASNPHHACVAFVAVALRQIGVALPDDEHFDGLVVTRISLALSHHLESAGGWRRIREPSRLQAGDVVFTRDAPCCPGVPDQVYVFMGWKDRDRLIAEVAESEGFARPRPLYPAPGAWRPDQHNAHEHATSAAFEYALRAPRRAAAAPLVRAA